MILTKNNIMLLRRISIILSFSIFKKNCLHSQLLSAIQTVIFHLVFFLYAVDIFRNKMQRRTCRNRLFAVLAAAHLQGRVPEGIQLCHTPAQVINVIIHIRAHITAQNDRAVKKQPYRINGSGKMIQVCLP